MRLLSEKQGLSVLNVDGQPKKEPAPVQVDKRARMAIPIPGAELFRKTK